MDHEWKIVTHKKLEVSRFVLCLDRGGGKFTVLTGYRKLKLRNCLKISESNLFDQMTPAMIKTKNSEKYFKIGKH